MKRAIAAILVVSTAATLGCDRASDASINTMMEPSGAAAMAAPPAAGMGPSGAAGASAAGAGGMGGSGAGGVGGVTGGAPAMETGGADAMVPIVADAMVPVETDGGAAGTTDAGTVPPEVFALEDPASLAEGASAIWGAGIGVTDLEGTTQFFVDFLDMEIEGRFTRSDRESVVLWAKSKRGYRVILTKFADGRNTMDIESKLLFLVPNVADLYERMLDAGYTTNFPPTFVPPITAAVAQLKGPEGYDIEISEIATESSFFISLGFGVTDSPTTQSFYVEALGLEPGLEFPFGGLMIGEFQLPDEVVVTYPGQTGVALVILSYREAADRVFRNNPVNTVHLVPDVPAILSKVTAAGGSMIEPLAPRPELNGRMGAVVADPDGYLIELIQR